MEPNLGNQILLKMRIQKGVDLNLERKDKPKPIKNKEKSQSEFYHKCPTKTTRLRIILITNKTN